MSLDHRSLPAEGESGDTGRGVSRERLQLAAITSEDERTVSQGTEVVLDTTGLSVDSSHVGPMLTRGFQNTSVL